MKRYTCAVQLTFELEANNEDDALEAVELMLQWVKAAVSIARGFKHVTSHIPINEPRRVHVREVTDV